MLMRECYNQDIKSKIEQKGIASMESICVGAFILISLMAIILVASPLSLGIGAIIFSVRKSDPRRLLQAAVAMIITFIIIVILACMVLLIWNPQI